MNARTRFLNMAAVAAFLLSASGCVCVVGGGGGGTSGDITFLWTFNSRTCAELQEITQVTIQMPGQTLQSNGQYDCITGGTAGIKLLNFRPGTYTYAIQGRNASGVVLYEGGGTVKVNGNVTVNVDLQPSATAPGAATVTWTFPPNGASNMPNCAQAGVVNVIINVDDSTVPSTVSCDAGFMTSGVVVKDLLAGQHTIDLTAVDASGFAYYRKRSTLTIVAGATVSSAYSFDWAVGSLPLKWNLNDGTYDQTCQQAGITEVYINMKDTLDQFVYQGAGVNVPCDDNGLQGTNFVYFPSGTYRIYIQANAPASVLYQSNITSPPSLTVTAGAFPVVDSSTPIITVTRQ